MTTRKFRKLIESKLDSTRSKIESLEQEWSELCALYNCTAIDQMPSDVKKYGVDFPRGPRKVFQMTQKELAEKAGLSTDTVRSWELGRSTLRFKQAVKLGRVFAAMTGESQD